MEMFPSSALHALLLCALLSPGGGHVPNCQEVRAVFHTFHPGSKWVPENPVSGSDLQICQSKGSSCCSRKMEERYQAAARSNMESGLQSVSAQLKRLIIQNAAIFQEAFDLVLRHGRNSTLSLLRSEFPALGSGVNSLVGQLFMDMSLYILGSDSSVNHMVSVLYGRLFPLAYRRLLGGAAPSVSEDCLRGAWKDSGAFGSYPKLLMTRLSRSLLATRVFLQALNLGIEVVNTTDHLRPGRDCSRSLLRLWFCPHCQGQLEPAACKGLCQVVMQGCLGGAVEVQPHWSTYVEGLGKLAGAMRAEQDMEAVVLRLPTIIKLSLKHMVNAKTRITTLMSGMCGHSPQRSARSVGLPPLPQLPPAPVSRSHPQSGSHRPSAETDETLTGLRREFISSLRGFISFYSGLGEALCSREPPPANSSLCWNGHEMTDRFSGPGLKRSHPGPESRNNKPPEPVISQIIDKLKHINQLLRMVSMAEKRWRARSRPEGAEDGGDGFGSGDCDDEDDCSGTSGLGPPPRRKRLRVFAEIADNMDDFTFQEQLLTPRLATGNVEGVSSRAATWKHAPISIFFTVAALRPSLGFWLH